MITRNTIFAILIIAGFGATLFSSCAEDAFTSDIAPSQTSENVDNGERIMTRSAPSLHYFDNHDPDGVAGVDYGCFIPPYRCFAPVVVVGKKKDIADYMTDSIGIWTTSEFQDFVDDNSSDLEDMIGSDETSGLSDGSYSLAIRTSTADDLRIFSIADGLTLVSHRQIDE